MLPISMCLMLLLASVLANPGVNLKFSEEELQRYFAVDSEEKAPEYEIIYPEYVTMEHKRHVGRSAVATSYLEVHVDTFGETLRMALEHDDSGFMPGLEAEYVSDEGTITVPVRTDCLYTGQVIGDSNSLVSVSACAGLMAVVNHASGPTYIEPLDDEHALKRDIGRGLPHFAYRVKPNQDRGRCGVKDDLTHFDVINESGQEVDDQAGDFDPQATKYLELGLIGDPVLYDLRGGNTHTCITALFNAAKNVLQLGSLSGASLVPKVTHIKVMTSSQSGLNTCPDSEQSLNKASDWQAANNFGASDSRRWDNAAILTGWVMDSGDTLGVAWRSNTQILCDERDATSLSTFRDLRTTDTLAHEIGHNLSMRHDGVGNSCPTSGYIMAANANSAKSDPVWSTCSRSYYTSHIGAATCYDDA
ncbi:zinc metalloproteinase-disintegrin jerdonitin-like [Patiria miniata]|uniref:Peptidase M12B domain-containing protein n=1 Tax=Patiria miniata TaxID=46514 RepID=A0A914BDR2_PATMI|nr:zinc metalloproteinase-disintegrin jerdonitin-like [Patiria miniata]